MYCASLIWLADKLIQLVNQYLVPGFGKICLNITKVLPDMRWTDLEKPRRTTGARDTDTESYT